MINKDVNYYLGLPYTVHVRRDQGEDYACWFAEVLELPGCMTQANTNEELGEMIQDTMRAWIETALEDGETIPEPRDLDDYSGKFVVRVPKSLHRDLVVAAELEGVSLNQWVNVLLAKANQNLDYRMPAKPQFSVSEKPD